MPRSVQTELLDKEDIPFEDIKQNMEELNLINSLLGGHACTIAGIKKILTLSKCKDTPLHICEVGCGGGDNLRAVEQWCRKEHIAVHLTGIDKKKECIDFAKEKGTDHTFTWIHSDYRLADFSHQKPDIIFSSLFCHHFSDDALVPMMQWMQNNSNLGFFINDLHRNMMAYYSIKAITTIFSKSYLVRHDAPLSVLRGFKRQDWEKIMRIAGIRDYSITWKWAFRWLLIITRS
ncbi:MAG: methyltransferase domain-containing protein [Chitinophagaceae bacterium]|nr:methyltransferase domain-containing protein [Chitinophagaceae bacterium]